MKNLQIYTQLTDFFKTTFCSHAYSQNHLHFFIQIIIVRKIIINTVAKDFYHASLFILLYYLEY